MAAIYQWIIGDEVVYTTTLYPIEAEDSLQLTVTVQDGGYLSNFPVDNVSFSWSPEQFELVTLLLSSNTDTDYVQFEWEPREFELVELLLSANTDVDYVQFEWAPIDFEIIDMLVICDTPDESLQFTVTVNAGNSSLTPV